ncbi:hypothetical protein GCM10009661_45080 [Catellatospora chokoriensis]|uniref:Type II restriction enzyme NaeI domain-containing protein n=1 Tax=Catellatospora chokoriensis TaxID=310353 RepID=A0A8J3NT13_9ACTN|nr:hypothetical protein Cch02nite_49710 [Catellatospora chokoriensis]
MIEICSPEQDRKRELDRARQLLQRATANPTPVQIASQPPQPTAGDLRQVLRLQEQLLLAKDDLAAAVAARHAAELEVARLTALVGARPGTDPEHNEPESTALPQSGTKPPITSARQGDAKEPEQPESQRDSHSVPERSPVRVDDAAAQVAKELAPHVQRIGPLLRNAFDYIIDGRHTGRLDLQQLTRTEKIYLVERSVFAVREGLDLAPGRRLDAQVAGHDVKICFTTGTNWLVPREATGAVLLLVSASEAAGTYRVGILQATDDALSAGQNLDGKRAINVLGRGRIRWLLRDDSLPENVFATMPPSDLNTLLSVPSGVKRVCELFRRVQQRPIGTAALQTASMQFDAAKRVRDARGLLRAEGITVLNHLNAALLHALDLPVLQKGQYLSVRLYGMSTPNHDRPSVFIDGTWWTVAKADEPVQPLDVRVHRWPFDSDAGSDTP